MNIFCICKITCKRLTVVELIMLRMLCLFTALLVSGFTAFTPKFIESQFSISAGLAAQLVGK